MSLATIVKKSAVTSNGNIILSLTIASTQVIFGKEVPVKKKYCMALPEAIAEGLELNTELPINLAEFSVERKESEEGNCTWLFPKG